ncbi:hypothetical protein CFAM422_004741 [Trichoderma lentiforme]|uniref:Uncharacterized protein n=1 Tax=Trichoderma lentiforme TaxID=1567552 RepID=A0A9P4XJH2_9HYPO|nr:hypothetical protein CFAM422_004741 [Trichoderma lentiforme]
MYSYVVRGGGLKHAEIAATEPRRKLLRGVPGTSPYTNGTRAIRGSARTPYLAQQPGSCKQEASITGPLHFGCPRLPIHGGAQQHHQTIPRPAVAPPAPRKYHLLGLLATLLSLGLMMKVWHSIYLIKYVSNSQIHSPHRPAALHRPKSAGASTDASSLQSPEATANHLTP